MSQEVQKSWGVNEFVHFLILQESRLKKMHTTSFLCVSHAQNGGTEGNLAHLTLTSNAG